MEQRTGIKEDPSEPDAGAPPKVSVACITYGHEAYIGQAIEGVLKQEVDFPIEMVIGEDCSPDRTRDIILEYDKKHPGLIKLSEYPENVGAGVNFRTTINRCRGEYIAFVDGDDYWTSPHKLRKQVELMDAHPEYSECFHAVSFEYEDGSGPAWSAYPPGRRPVYRLSDLAKWIRMTPSSTLFRRSCFHGFPSWWEQVFFGDWMLQILLAEEGDIGYIDEIMGVKRLHEESILFGSAAKNTGTHLENIANQCEFICRHLGDERSIPFAHSRDEARYRLVHHHLAQGENAKARELLREVLKSSGGYNPQVARHEPMLSYVHVHVPRLYGLLRKVWRETWHRTAWHRSGSFAKRESAK